MKDLDFDELDRAVNSLMGDVPKTAPEKKDDEPQTLTISPTLTKDATPDFSKIEDNAAVIAPSTPPSEPAPSRPEPAAATSLPVPSRPPAARRAGRFMDVVHPSSVSKKPATPVSRQGVTVEPAAPAKSTAPVIAESPTVEQASSIDTSAIPAPTTPSASDNEWPDPLDIAGYKHEDEPVEDQPLSSPFLSGTKVEKRPLGGATSADEPEAVEAQEPDRTPVLGANASDTATKDDPNDQLPAQPEIEVPLPEELQGDLVAIESGSHSVAAPNKVESEPTRSVENESQPPVTTTADEPKEDVVPSGPTSIPQQYKEEKTTGDTVSGAIYDTDTYHQPLAHPAEKKSGWMWVLWIAIILVVGAGGGAALFFLGVF